MADLPTGTVTFLFTDIEGSTRVLQRHGDGYMHLLERHAELIRAAVVTHDGVEVHTEGDSFFVVFRSAPGGVRAAVDAQRALMAEPWPAGGEMKVRMGLHTGEGMLGGDNYVGLDVHRAARIMSAAHGRQIVVSAATRALVSDGVDFVDIGKHRLKDLERPEHLFQVAAHGLPREFPPLRSLESQHNLPAEVSSFLGRDDLIAAAHARLDKVRLLTLTGPGGVGKTRLALRMASDRLDRHADGVWLAELAGVADPELVSHTVLAALGGTEQPGRDSIESLVAHLGSRDALLVIDNCEHLIDAAADLVQRILADCRNAKVLATSREPLGVAGEAQQPVPPMATGGADGASEAVELFIERARAAVPGFEDTDEARATMATIVRRLDGLPLAIELAAARVRALSLDDLAEHLDDRLSVLAGSRRSAHSRHETIEATVVWSYDLLDQEEKDVFRVLGIFAGPFDLAAAERVTAHLGVNALSMVTSLVDRSLLSVVRDEGKVRYRMLETVKAFARKWLDTEDELATVEAEHTAWALEFAQQIEQEIIGPAMRQLIQRVRANIDDLRAVFARGIERSEPEIPLRILAALEAFLLSSTVREGSRWLERLLAFENIDPKVRAAALSTQGTLLGLQSEPEPAQLATEQAIAIFEELGDELGVARARVNLVMAAWHRLEPERLRALLRSSLEVLRSELEGGLARRMDLQYIGRAVYGLAMWEFEFGDPEAANALAETFMHFGRQTGAVIMDAHGAETLALQAHFLGDHEEARTRFTDAIDAYRRSGVVQCLAHCIEHVALWAVDDRPSDAAGLLAAVETLRTEQMGGSVPAFERKWHDEVTAEVKQKLGPGFDEAFAIGWGVDPTEAADLVEAVLHRSS
jgi:predicted ATPase/class 3 adenylate cyclase